MDDPGNWKMIFEKKDQQTKPRKMGFSHKICKRILSHIPEYLDAVEYPENMEISTLFWTEFIKATEIWNIGKFS